MTDDTKPFEPFHCPSCGKPTTESLNACRHCHRYLRGEKKGQVRNSIFADEGPGVKWGCYGTLAAMLIGLVLLLGYCSNRRAETAAAEAAQAKADQAKANAEYEESVVDGTVCADGYNGSNLALINRVKSRLRDPDSFEHDRTVISKRSSTGGYLAVMQYRAKNGFGGYTGGVATAALTLAGRGDCQVKDFRLLE